MEYGHEIIDSAGNKTFFVEGCAYCLMSTGGEHERRCKPLVVEPLIKEVMYRNKKGDGS